MAAEGRCPTQPYFTSKSTPKRSAASLLHSIIQLLLSHTPKSQVFSFICSRFICPVLLHLNKSWFLMKKEQKKSFRLVGSNLFFCFWPRIACVRLKPQIQFKNGRGDTRKAWGRHSRAASAQPWTEHHSPDGAYPGTGTSWPPTSVSPAATTCSAQTALVESALSLRKKLCMLLSLFWRGFS